MGSPSLPPIPEPLVRWLDQQYPERLPDPGWTDREIWMAVGRREVVRLLLAHLNLQLKDQHVSK